ncbi:MAG: aminotransferase [Clostridiaceae bacterium]|nr:aminotransferase [Clostridiaceae bacterium]
MNQLVVFLEKNKQNLKPLSGSKGSAGLDILAAENKIILPGQTVLVKTDLKMAIPNGYEIQIRPRSGISLKTTLRIPNSPGTIDSDYRDEIKVICQNTKRFDDWKNDLLLDPSVAEKISQMKQISYYDYLINNKQTENFDKINKKLIEELKSEILLIDSENIPYGSIRINAGDRFAQMIFASYFVPDFKLSDDVSSIGANRGGGFGSTGKN